MKNIKKMQRENLNRFLLVSRQYNSEENFKKIDKIKSIIEELSLFLSRSILDRIMKTHKDYEYGVKFLRFLHLHRKMDMKDINNNLKISNNRLVEGWYRGLPPRPVISLLNIYFKNYHKINKRDLAYLFGWGFGDGGLNSRLSYYFICGKKNDLLKIKGYLNQKIPTLPFLIDKNVGKNLIKQFNGKTITISGNDSWILYIKDSCFCRLLYSLGLPKGAKVLQYTKIPEWVRKGSKETRKAFLDALFEGELQTHKVKYNLKRNKIDICPISLGLSKVQEYKINSVDFLNEIRDMLQKFDIKSTKVEEPKPSNIRKDGLVSYSSRFYISISALNTIKFSKIIHFPFNQEKKNALDKAVKEGKRKIANMNLQLIKYNKALKLFEDGSSMYEIAKELDIGYNTAKCWVKTKKHLPILLNQNSCDNLKWD